MSQTTSAHPADALLDDLGRRAWRWFDDHRHTRTGMVPDRSGARRGRGRPWAMASIAATGYHLSLLPYAVAQGWISPGDAANQAAVAMDFALNHTEQRHGLLHHFVDSGTGARWGASEFSLLDTAIFLNGCMVAAQAFPQTRVLADALLDRVEWDQLLMDHPVTGKRVLSLGIDAASGDLLSGADVRSSELAMAYFLATGSRTHPIPAQCWYNTDAPYRDVAGQRVLNAEHPLFTAQYGLGWAHLDGLVDRDGVDLAGNARPASLANRAYCRDLASKRSATYHATTGAWWGLSAGDGPRGYTEAGPVYGDPDGTVWPMAALASIPWLADEIRDDLAVWSRSPVWPMVNRTYGLAAFSVDTRWIAHDVVGIELGSFAVALANHRAGTVWDLWMSHPVAQSALQRLGYAPLAVTPPSRPGPGE